jgi:hypothetical protein
VSPARSRSRGTSYADPLAEIARDMRALPEETRKAVRPALRKAGEQVRREAAVNSSWSSRIPGTLKVSASFRQNREGVTVTAGGPNAPHARPYEGITSRGNTFRHPVFVRDVWVAQPNRPFLLPAAQAAGPTAEALIRDAMDDVGQSLGFN